MWRYVALAAKAIAILFDKGILIGMVISASLKHAQNVFTVKK